MKLFKIREFSCDLYFVNFLFNHYRGAWLSSDMYLGPWMETSGVGTPLVQSCVLEQDTLTPHSTG